MSSLIINTGNLNGTVVQGINHEVNGTQLGSIMGPAKLTQNMAAAYVSDDECRLDQKRSVHNEVERRRKSKLNTWIYQLGGLLPGNKDNKKPSKCEILEKAVEFIEELKDTNEKLLLNKCTESQAAEFKRMRNRITELEVRNVELNRLLDASGFMADPTIWQQSSKYSNKISPDSVSFLEHGNFCNNIDNRIIKPIKMKEDRKDCAMASAVSAQEANIMTNEKANNLVTSSTGIQPRPLTNTQNTQLISQNGLIFLPPGGQLQTAGMEIKPGILDSKCLDSASLQITQNIGEGNMGIPCPSQESVMTQPVGGNSVTAVTQALPGLPIMSTNQNTGSNQQLLQQLPVLNYGNTVNIFPGVAGQGQPMIIINEQGVPLLQGMMPGQVILNPATGQALGNITTSTGQVMLNPATSQTVQTGAVNGSGSVLLNPSTGQAVHSGSASASGSASVILNPVSGAASGPTNQVLINPSSASAGNIPGSQVILNPANGQPILTTGANMNNSGPVGSSSFLINSGPCQPVVSGSTLQGNNGNLSNQLILNTAPTFPNGPEQNPMLLNSTTGQQMIQVASQASNMNSKPVLINRSAGQTISGTVIQASNSGSLGITGPNQVVLNTVSDPQGLSAAGFAVQQAAVSNRLTNQNQMIVNPVQRQQQNSQHQAMLNGDAALQSVMGNQVIGQTQYIQTPQGPVQIVSQQSSNQSNPHGQMVAMNPNGSNSSLPSALILPNGQIIPVVSQPSLLYPSAAPINGGLIMAPPPNIMQSKISTTSASVTQHVNKEQIKCSSVQPRPNSRQARATPTSSVPATLSSATITTTTISQPLTADGLTSFGSPLMLAMPAQNDNLANSSVTSEPVVSKKSSKRSQRNIKPKPSVPTSRATVNTNPPVLPLLNVPVQQPPTTTVSQTKTSSTSTNVTSSTGSQGQLTPTSTNNSVKQSNNSNPNNVSNNNNSSTGNNSKPLSVTTDILAKATESIFANSMSDPSPPIASFYNCDSADYPGNGNELANNTDDNEAVQETPISSTVTQEEQTNGNQNTSQNDIEIDNEKENSIPSTDILRDLVADVYSTEDRDMPMLQPISPVVGNSSSNQNSPDQNSDQPAPQLNLAISNDAKDTSPMEDVPSLELVLPPNIKESSNSNKRSKNEDSNPPPKKTRVDTSKETSVQIQENKAIPPANTSASSSVNFLLVNQLASSNFSIDTTLSNENSPFSSISPLLVSPTKTNTSDTFLSTSNTGNILNSNSNKNSSENFIPTTISNNISASFTDNLTVSPSSTNGLTLNNNNNNSNSNHNNNNNNAHNVTFNKNTVLSGSNAECSSEIASLTPSPVSSGLNQSFNSANMLAVTTTVHSPSASSNIVYTNNGNTNLQKSNNNSNSTPVTLSSPLTVVSNNSACANSVPATSFVDSVIPNLTTNSLSSETMNTCTPSGNDNANSFFTPSNNFSTENVISTNSSVSNFTANNHNNNLNSATMNFNSGNLINSVSTSSSTFTSSMHNSNGGTITFTSAPSLVSLHTTNFASSHLVNPNTNSTTFTTSSLIPTPSTLQTTVNVSSSNINTSLPSTNTTNSSLHANSSSQNASFSMPDILQGSLNTGSQPSSFGTSGIGSSGQNALNQPQVMQDTSLLPNDVLPENVPSFSFGLFGQPQVGNTLTHNMQAGTDTNPHMSGNLPVFPQNYPSQNTGVARRLPGTSQNDKHKGIGGRRPSTVDNLLPPAVVQQPARSLMPPPLGSSPRTINHTSPQPDVAQQSPRPPVSPAFHHRSPSSASSYSAEALISQATYNHPQKQIAASSSRPSISYSAESLIQSQPDRRHHCSANSNHPRQHPSQQQQPQQQQQQQQQQQTAGSNQVSPYSGHSTSSLPYFSLHTGTKQSAAQSGGLAHFHPPSGSAKPSCPPPQTQTEFSFSLGQPINNQQNLQGQTHSGYPNVFHYPQPPSTLQKHSSGQVQFPHGDCSNMMGNQPQPAQQTNNCPNNTGSFGSHSNVVHSFSDHFQGGNGGNRNELPEVAVLPELTKPEKGKNKQDSQGKPGKSSKQQNQSKKKPYPVEEVNLSNSIFETNRSVTPYFTIPNLSPPRNEAPTYIPNPNLFNATQRPLTSNSSQQNKTAEIGSAYNPLFTPRSQSGLNLNFQAPGFGMNHIHGNSGVANQIPSHSNVPNFNLSNIFPDISSSGDGLNISPIKFHPGNAILPSEPQHHQAAPLYNRPVLHNGMINSLLAHNPHGFDGRPQVPMPINNTMPAAFHGHTHTASFSNVIPTLNFPMHEH